MKVFKIKKYHICYKDSVYALCSQRQKPTIQASSTTDSSSTMFGLEYDLVYLNNYEDYAEDMDLCKTCRQMNFVRMVNKLKGKYSA